MSVELEDKQLVTLTLYTDGYIEVCGTYGEIDPCDWKADLELIKLYNRLQKFVRPEEKS